jgi:hypothetical protein
MRGSLLLAALASSCALVASTPTATITGRLESGKGPYLNGTTVSLNGGASIATTDSTGSFTFYDVEPGIYSIEALSTTHMFPVVKVLYLEESMDKPKCNMYVYPGAEKQAIADADCANNLVMPAVATYDYFEKKPPFSVRGLFMNPMLIMMLVSGGAMYYMPKMMENMDPEQKAAMAKQMEMQSNMSDPNKM